MINLLITENRNFDPVRFARNRVRVFVGKDFSYGFWVDEDRLFELLSIDQKREYLTQKKANLEFKVDAKVARKVVDAGYTPHGKSAILRKLAELAA